MISQLMLDVLKLLISSDFTITFNRSQDYVRLCVTLHFFACLMVMLSSYAYVTMIMYVTALCVSFGYVMRHPTPHPLYLSMSYHERYWLLHTKKGEEISYEHVDLRVDAGFFMLFSLKNTHQRRWLIIFYDQLSVLEARMLHLIETTK